MQRRRSWKVDSSSASQICRILWNSKVHHCSHNNPPLGRILRQANPFHILSSSWVSIFVVFHHLRLGPPSDLLPSVFPTKAHYAPLLSHMCATCPTIQILDFMNLTIFGREYQSWSCAPCNLLISPVTPAHLGPQSSVAPHSHTSSAWVSPLWETKFHTHTKQYARLYFCQF